VNFSGCVAAESQRRKRKRAKKGSAEPVLEKIHNFVYQMKFNTLNISLNLF
jgi:hypothetical protein